MSKVLYIQFRDDVSVDHDIKSLTDAISNKDVEITVLNVFTSAQIEDVPSYLSQFSCVILGGSGQYYLSNLDSAFSQVLNRHSNIIDYILVNDYPTFGICFGHQYIAYKLGGEIRAEKEMAETGSVYITRAPSTELDTVFSEIPQVFYAQLGHKDSVVRLPEECTLTLFSDKCPVEGFKYKDNIYTVQFHPELNPQNILERFKLYSEYTNGKTDEELALGLHASEFSTQILLNFIDKFSN